MQEVMVWLSAGWEEAFKAREGRGSVKQPR